MSVPAAYLGVIVIWSTTPLAIKWSVETDFLFALTARMALGAVVASGLIVILRKKLEWHRKALIGYGVAGMGIYLSMGAAYWSLQHIPSGWMSVIFGLSPIMTAILAWMFLDEGRLSLPGLAGILLGVLSLLLIFSSSLSFTPQSTAGVAAALLSTFTHSASAIWLKRLQPVESGLVLGTGGMLCSLPLLFITGLIIGTDWSPALGTREIAMILYLGMIASAIGFTLYFFVLRNVSATRLSLITQITPVTCLLLGSWLNDEPVIAVIWLGAFLIIVGLVLFEYGQRIMIQPAKIPSNN